MKDGVQPGTRMEATLMIVLQGSLKAAANVGVLSLGASPYLDMLGGPPSHRLPLPQQQQSPQQQQQQCALRHPDQQLSRHWSLLPPATAAVPCGPVYSTHISSSTATCLRDNQAGAAVLAPRKPRQTYEHDDALHHTLLPKDRIQCRFAPAKCATTHVHVVRRPGNTHSPYGL